MRTVRILILSAVLSACGAEPAPDGDPDDPVILALWVQEHPYLSKKDVLIGCEAWRPEGYRCAIVSDPTVADVRISADAKPCAPNDDGTVTVGWANSEGIVKVMTECLSRDGAGIPDRRQFQTVIGHEIGHEIGIWDHVPYACDGTEKIHESGIHVCGRAMMNPVIGPWYETELDGLAYDLRDRYNAVPRPDRYGPGTRALAQGAPTAREASCARAP